MKVFSYSVIGSGMDIVVSPLRKLCFRHTPENHPADPEDSAPNEGQIDANTIGDMEAEAIGSTADDHDEEEDSPEPKKQMMMTPFKSKTVKR
ncbi:hypothetical protein PINS_up015091 [Pythium insidiosum]|nr:hypothetical protein PINS_up015091 [Pythium insidiosum]